MLDSNKLATLNTTLRPSMWYTSRRAWGSIATMIQAGALLLWNVELTGQELNALITLGVSGGTFLAGALTLYGSLKARGPLVFRKTTFNKINAKVYAAAVGD